MEGELVLVLSVMQDMKNWLACISCLDSIQISFTPHNHNAHTFLLQMEMLYDPNSNKLLYVHELIRKSEAPGSL